MTEGNGSFLLKVLVCQGVNRMSEASDGISP
jgi:hypothetical protein